MQLNVLANNFLYYEKDSFRWTKCVKYNIVLDDFRSKLLYERVFRVFSQLVRGLIVLSGLKQNIAPNIKNTEYS